MEDIIKVIAAILPAIALIWYVYHRDYHHTEPVINLVKGVGWGIVAAAIAFVVEIPLLFAVGLDSPSNFWLCLYESFVETALPEECCKALCLYLFLRHEDSFETYMGGIIYAVCVGMGFAAVENVIYVINSDHWLELSIERALFSVSGHFLFAVLMGYFFSIWRLEEYRVNFYLMLLAPILAHGVVNVIANSIDMAPSWEIWLTVLWIFLLYRLYKWCGKLIDSHFDFDSDFLDSANPK